jgi:hypothetical protein
LLLPIVSTASVLPDVVSIANHKEACHEKNQRPFVVQNITSISTNLTFFAAPSKRLMSYNHELLMVCLTGV